MIVDATCSAETEHPKRLSGLGLGILSDVVLSDVGRGHRYSLSLYDRLQPDLTQLSLVPFGSLSFGDCSTQPFLAISTAKQTYKRYVPAWISKNLKKLVFLAPPLFCWVVRLLPTSDVPDVYAPPFL